MPQLGNIAVARDIGYKTGNGKSKFIWSACVDCGKERWVLLSHKKPTTLRCQICSRKLGSRPQGGRRETKKGYIDIKVHPDDFYFAMACRGYVPEHRLVMARNLGRCLHPWEIIHHRNGDKTDNRLENLQLTLAPNHNQITIMEQRIKLLEGRVTLLEAENALLKIYRGL